MHTSPRPDEAFASALGLLYHAAVFPDLWPNALDALEPLFASSAAHFFYWDRAADCPTLSIPSHNYRGQGDYQHHYGSLDPRRGLLMRQPPGFLLLCHEHFDEGFVRRSEFFNDYSLPVGRRWVMTTSLWDQAGTAAVFAVFRPPGAPPYSAADRARLQCLLPHLRRAFRLDQRLRTARAEAGVGQSLLDALPVAVLATDASGRIRHANRAAEALLASGSPLRQQQGRLVAATPAETAALQAALHRALQAPANTASGPAASLILHCGEGVRVAVTVTPLGRRVALPDLPEGPLALVYASPLDPPCNEPEPLRIAFGFTGAEAKLAAALAGGQRLAAIAAARGVSMPTVRTQLRAVFEKTGTSRQAELVRLLAHLPVTATAMPKRGSPP